jgi:Tfp pilus assembly protein PilF
LSLIDNLEKMLADGKDDAMLRFGLGNAYFQSKDYEQAVRHLAGALDFDKSYSAAWKLLGRSYMQLGRLDEARRTFDEGLAHAEKQGDKQAVKEMQVFLKKIDKQQGAS